jgi:hypothetical protein
VNDVNTKFDLRVDASSAASLDAVRTASKSQKKPPPASCDGDEGTAAPPSRTLSNKPLPLVGIPNIFFFGRRVAPLLDIQFSLRRPVRQEHLARGLPAPARGLASWIRLVVPRLKFNIKR